MMRGIHYLKRNGVKEAFFKAVERLQRDEAETNQTDLFSASFLSDEELKVQRSRNFTHRYKISILVPS